MRAKRRVHPINLNPNVILILTDPNVEMLKTEMKDNMKKCGSIHLG